MGQIDVGHFYRRHVPPGVRTAVRNLRNTARRMGTGALIAMTYPLAVWARKRGLRGLRPDAQLRIGHLVGESLVALSWATARTGDVRRVGLPFRRARVCNEEVVSRLNPQYFGFSGRSRVVGALVSTIAGHPLLQLPTLDAVAESPAAIYTIDPLTLPRLIVERNGDEQIRSRLLGDLGLDPQVPYVCLHVRSEGYATIDDHVQAHRNADLDTYSDAVKLLLETGLQVIRVGGPHGGYLPHWAGTADYAHSEYRSPRHDLLLASGCDSFLGNTSGLYLLAAVHGRPILGVNMAPMNTFGLLGRTTLSIPKLLYSRRLGRLLSFREAASSPLGNSLGAILLHAEQVSTVPNSSAEITDALKDFLALRGREGWELLAGEREWQVRFRRCLPPDAYGIRSSTLVAPSFLRRHVELLD